MIPIDHTYLKFAMSLPGTPLYVITLFTLQQACDVATFVILAHHTYLHLTNKESKAFERLTGLGNMVTKLEDQDLLFAALLAPGPASASPSAHLRKNRPALCWLGSCLGVLCIPGASTVTSYTESSILIGGRMQHPKIQDMEYFAVKMQKESSEFAEFFCQLNSNSLDVPFSCLSYSSKNCWLESGRTNTRVNTFVSCHLCGF